MPKINFNSQLSLQDKVILVTGAGSGIGEQIAVDCANRGAQVILLGRTVGKLERTYDLIIEKQQQAKEKSAQNITHHEPSIFPLNLSGANDQHYKELATIIDEQYGRLDGLIHNAAILGNISPIKLYAPQQWYKVIQVNLNAVFMLTQSCMNILEKSPNASIIFTSSGVAQKTDAYWGAYAISKAASDHLMKTLAIEFQDTTSMRANSFSPGAVATRMRALVFPGERPCTLTQTSQIAPYYAQLISDHTQHINGEIITPNDFINAPPITHNCKD